MKNKEYSLVAALVLGMMLAPTLTGQRYNQTISHVLLISIDGMHAVNLINCVNGISGAIPAIGLVSRTNGYRERRISAQRRSVLRRRV